MRIAILLAEEVDAAISVWLTTLGHELVAITDEPQRLVLDHQHLQNINSASCPVPSQHWLLIDSQLSTTQTIQALQQSCGYITIAPLDKNTLENWLAGTSPLPNMLALAPNPPLPSPALDPHLDLFIDIVTKDIWTAEQQQQAKQLIPWRDIGLQLPQFQSLQQEGKLSMLEQAQLACHTLAGAELLNLHGQHDAAQIALQHHEHFDGTGYPKQLKDEAIHPIASLAKLYDAYTGLRKEKAYAKALDHDTAIQKLQYGDGYLWPTQFDPELMKGLVHNEQMIAGLF